jgi:hypothetical protein
MSVRWMRSAQVSRGRIPEGLAWAKEVSSYVEKKFALPAVEVYMDSFGDVGTIRWMMDFPDLNAVEAAFAKTMADADYWKMLERATKSELFIDGSVHDTVCRKI